MIGIFLFSSQTGEASGNMSRFVTRLFIRFFAPEGYVPSEAMLDLVQKLVRKGAHFFVFFALAFCIANTIRQLTDSKWRVFWISLSLSSFYAATDELHQYFIPGRVATWQDWVLDTIGALSGIIIVLLLFCTRKVPNCKDCPLYINSLYNESVIINLDINEP